MDIYLRILSERSRRLRILKPAVPRRGRVAGLPPRWIHALEPRRGILGHDSDDIRTGAIEEWPLTVALRRVERVERGKGSERSEAEERLQTVLEEAHIDNRCGQMLERNLYSRKPTMKATTGEEDGISRCWGQTYTTNSMYSPRIPQVAPPPPSYHAAVPGKRSSERATAC